MADMEQIAKDIGKLQGEMAGVLSGIIQIHTRMDAGRDANIKVQDEIKDMMKQHDRNDESRHKDVMNMVEKIETERKEREAAQDEDIDGLKTFRTEYETARKLVVWIISIGGLTLLGLVANALAVGH